MLERNESRRVPGDGAGAAAAPALIPAWVDGVLVPVEKFEVHRRGLRHKAVSVFVICGDEVLIQRRAMGKYHTPGLWANSCCTHPHWGEAPEACARRRLGEELGITGFSPEFRHRVEYRADVGGGLVEHELADIFILRTEERIAPAPDPAEVMDTAWADIEALRRDIRAAPGRYTPWLRIYMAEHSAPIFAGL